MCLGRSYCHPKVALGSQAASETHGTTKTLNNRPASSSFFFFGGFGVPGLIPCQLPVICKEKKKAARPVLRILTQILTFGFGPHHGLASAGRGESGDSQ